MLDIFQLSKLEKKVGIGNILGGGCDGLEFWEQSNKMINMVAHPALNPIVLTPPPQILLSFSGNP